MSYEPIEVADVFIAGNYPDVTYNPRASKALESEVTRYLRQRGKCLVISGPSKAGKTVLVEHLLPRDFAVWVSGNRIASVDDFWSTIVDRLDAYTTVERRQGTGHSVAVDAGISGSVPGFLRAKLSLRPKFERNEQVGGSHIRTAASTVLEYLAHTPVPIVVDDFHYIDEGVRKAVTLAVKELILKTRVIMIAVPHEAFDIVRSTRDMDGRVWKVEVSGWDRDELVQIARKGFEVLSVADPHDVVAIELADASFGAPFLMQQLCQDLLWDNDFYESREAGYDLSPPTSWQSLFRSVADRHEPGVFPKLKQGAATRGTPRTARTLNDGRVTDIYGLTLLGISDLLPKREYHYRVLTGAVEKFIESDPTRSQQITQALKQLASIAEDNRDGTDAAIAYKEDVLSIADPFLAFYLGYGSWDLPDV
ncbi:ATP-binding protein [Cryobacterium sp. M23]|uniref:ATP-binding protein n=1 Tax=Cryobacterium sp. M23 TaxID=2048292 RepID=UPI0011AFE527|nr:ATP-binding protein [Cryobacterium sp. M23]